MTFFRFVNRLGHLTVSALPAMILPVAPATAQSEDWKLTHANISQSTIAAKLQRDSKPAKMTSELRMKSLVKIDFGGDQTQVVPAAPKGIQKFSRIEEFTKAVGLNAAHIADILKEGAPEGKTKDFPGVFFCEIHNTYEYRVTRTNHPLLNPVR